MAKISTFHLAHVPHNLLVHVALYKELRNAEFLRRQLLEGNQDFEYGFLDARMVLSTTQVLAAVFKAINDMESKRLKSHNVHSEIVFCMSPNNNVSIIIHSFNSPAFPLRNVSRLQSHSENLGYQIVHRICWWLKSRNRELGFVRNT